MSIRRPVIILFFILIAVTSATAFELTVVRTLGGDDDELFLHNPSSVTFAPDGTIYLLNAGECQVLHLDSDWNLLNSFGRCGQGPGEFENSAGMVLHDGHLWVFEMARIVVYTLEGELARTLVPGTQFSSPCAIDGQLMAVMGTGDKTAAQLDDEGRPVTWFGPTCPADFFEAFKTCRNMRILPHDDGLCLLLDPVAARALLVGSDGEVAWERDIIDHEIDANYQESDDGESATMSLSFGMGLGCRDAEGRYWFSLPPKESDGPARLRVTDGRMNTLGADIVLPEDVFGWQLAFSPRGELVLVSGGDSTVVVCEVSGGSGDD